MEKSAPLVFDSWGRVTLPDYPKDDRCNVVFVYDESTQFLTMYKDEENIAETLNKGQYIVFKGSVTLAGDVVTKAPILYLEHDDMETVIQQNELNKQNGLSPMIISVKDGEVRIFANDQAHALYASMKSPQRNGSEN